MGLDTKSAGRGFSHEALDPCLELIRHLKVIDTTTLDADQVMVVASQGLVKFEPGVFVPRLDTSDHTYLDKFAKVAVGRALCQAGAVTGSEDLRESEGPATRCQDLDHREPGAAVAHRSCPQPPANCYVQVLEVYRIR
jgi:hypothetical protein|tara:strand:- start:19081 stop:19494 length:414 start_codon:yes stop_codon:yes gene_type:complete